MKKLGTPEEERDDHANSLLEISNILSGYDHLSFKSADDSLREINASLRRISEALISE